MIYRGYERTPENHERHENRGESTAYQFLSVKYNTPQMIKQSKQEPDSKQKRVILHVRDLWNFLPKHSIDTRSLHRNKERLDKF